MYGNRAAQRQGQNKPAIGSGSSRSIQREYEWDEPAPPIPYASWDDYYYEQQQPSTSIVSTVPSPSPASHDSGAPTDIEESRESPWYMWDREDSQEYQEHHQREIRVQDAAMLRGARTVSGAVSDGVGLSGSILQGAAEGQLTRSAARVARSGGTAASSASPGLISEVAGPLGAVTSGISVVTGLSTMLDPDPDTSMYDRITGGLSAASGAIGLMGSSPVLGATAVGEGAMATGGAWAGGAAIGTGGAVLGAGLAGLSVGDLLVSGSEWLAEATGARTEGEQQLHLGDITGTDLVDGFDMLRPEIQGLMSAIPGLGAATSEMLPMLTGLSTVDDPETAIYRPPPITR